MFVRHVAMIMLVLASTHARGDELIVVNAQETARNVTACVQRTAQPCVNRAVPRPMNIPIATGSYSMTADECLLIWKICENDPANIVQSKVIVGYEAVTKQLTAEIKQVVEAVKKSFDTEIERQNKRFMELLKALGWNVK